MKKQVKEVSENGLMAVEAGNDHVHPLIAGVLNSVAPARVVKRTPGPWRVEEPTPDENGIPHFHYIVSQNGEDERLYVASTWSRPNIYDATLIALAPELAEALAALVTAPLRYNGNQIEIGCSSHGAAMRLVINARAVLAKLEA